MPFPDLCARLEIEADDEGEETVSGYFVARLGRLPRQGDQVLLGRYTLTASELKGRRASRIRIAENVGAPETTDGETGSA
jgi:CBS domain containing-hemolysin-like protein